MQNKAKLIHRYFGIFISLLTVVVGILFIVQACGIFADAGYIQGGYSRETIGTRFLYICAPFFIWIAAIITGFVLSVIYPYSPKQAPVINNALVLKRLTPQIPEGIGSGYSANLKTVKSERVMRFITAVTLAVICIVCIIISCIYLFNINNFKGVTNNDAMFNMFKVVGQCLLLALLCSVVAVALTKFSIRMELNAVKSLIANGKGAPVRTDMQHPVDKISGKISTVLSKRPAKKALFITRIVVLSTLAVLAITFIILGIFNDGMRSVLAKAIDICTECIGLG